MLRLEDPLSGPLMPIEIFFFRKGYDVLVRHPSRRKFLSFFSTMSAALLI